MFARTSLTDEALLWFSFSLVVNVATFVCMFTENQVVCFADWNVWQDWLPFISDTSSGDGSAGDVLAMQVLGPEFWALAPTQKPALSVDTCKLRTPGTSRQKQASRSGLLTRLLSLEKRAPSSMRDPYKTVMVEFGLEGNTWSQALTSTNSSTGKHTCICTCIAYIMLYYTTHTHKHTQTQTHSHTHTTKQETNNRKRWMNLDLLLKFLRSKLHDVKFFCFFFF